MMDIFTHAYIYKCMCVRVCVCVCVCVYTGVLYNRRRGAVGGGAGAQRKYQRDAKGRACVSTPFASSPPS